MLVKISETFWKFNVEDRKVSKWDGGYQLSDGGKGKKKDRTVPFMQCSNEQISFWKRLQDVVGCLDVRFL